MQDLMRHADERIYIHTPYAVFSKDMYDDMTAIAEQTDDFTMLVNSTAVGDNVMASSDYTHNRNNIIQTGVTLYEFYGDHSSHGKSILIDDDLSIIGSYNLDMRSTYVDTETMLVLHSPQLNQQLEEHLQTLEKDSLLIASDGALLPEASNPPIRLSKRKEAMFAITSRLFQLTSYSISFNTSKPFCTWLSSSSSTTAFFFSSSSRSISTSGVRPFPCRSNPLGV